MSTFESRRFWRSIAVGVALTLLTIAADRIGLLSVLEGFFYDQRAKFCQTFSVRPDDRIVHLDIDDASLDAGAVGRWPWPRRKLARIIDEVGLAKPAAIGLDLWLSEPSKDPDEAATTQPGDSVDDDAILSQCLARQRNLVLGAALKVASSEETRPNESMALEALNQNLEMGALDFESAMKRRGIDIGGTYEAQDLFVHARAIAMRDRVSKELDGSALTDDQLIAKLLPHADPTVKTPALKMLLREATAFRTRREFRRFGLPVPVLPLPAVPAEMEGIPLQEFSKSAAYTGFFTFDVFNSPTLRSVPMVIDADHRLYPQFGLAFACAVAGADITKARIGPNQIAIPTSGKDELLVPTHNFYSQAMRREFLGISDVPWFGGTNWLTMYDWPNYRRQVNHISVNTVWDICRTIDRIQANNRTFDLAIQVVFGDEGLPRLDIDFARKYAASLPPIDDSAAREKVAASALAELNDFQAIEGLSAIPPGDRNRGEQERLDQLVDGKKALAIGDSNRGLQKQLNDFRAELARRLEGKGVLLGWTAEGLADKVNTSLHLRCPGIVVHGVIAESVLRSQWWHQPPKWVGVALILLLGFATSFFVAWMRPFRALIATLMLLTFYLALNGYIFFDYGKWLVPVAGPVVAISVVWSGCTLQRVIFEGIERNRIATEVAIINREMDLARKVQAALIPKHAPSIPALEADGWTKPADATGGDCYDLWTLQDGRLAILLCDASGHGLAPAMIVSQVRTLVRALSEVELHPTDLLKRVNARVADDLEAGRFITVFLGFLSSNGELEYAAAGHGPQFWYGTNGTDLHELDSTGAPLGCDTEWLCDDPLPPIQIADGGTLVIFSDGIFEAMTPTGETFGIDRLKDLLNTTRGQSGKTIIGKVTAAMHTWQQQHPPADDQTVVIARRIPLAAE